MLDIAFFIICFMGAIVLMAVFVCLRLDFGKFDGLHLLGTVCLMLSLMPTAFGLIALSSPGGSFLDGFVEGSESVEFANPLHYLFGITVEDPLHILLYYGAIGLVGCALMVVSRRRRKTIKNAPCEDEDTD